jgi:hypothetical protein
VNPTKEEVVADVETCIRSLPYLEKENVRNEIRDILTKPFRSDMKSPTKSDETAMNLLKDKDCYFLKADKGNSVVILDKEDYVERVNKLIENGAYTQLPKTPLPRMIRETRHVHKIQ